MTKSKISLAKALDLLNQGKMSKEYEIEFLDDDRIEAADALKLGSLGIHIPEDKIYYNDSDINDEIDLDDGWMQIESDIEDYKKHLKIKLKVDKEIEEWLSTAKIDMDSLVSELITGFYKSTKTIKN